MGGGHIGTKWVVVGRLCFFILIELQKKSWKERKEWCEERKTHLVSINSIEEQTIIEKQFEIQFERHIKEKRIQMQSQIKMYQNYDMLYIGATRINPYISSGWHWQDGSELKWTNWESMDGEKFSGMCSALQKNKSGSWKWRTVYCDSSEYNAWAVCAKNATYGNILWNLCNIFFDAFYVLVSTKLN